MAKFAFNAKSLGDLIVLPAQERRAVFAGLLESRTNQGWDKIWTKPHKERIPLDDDYVVVGWLLAPHNLLVAYVGRESALNFEQLYSQYATLSQQDYANIITCEIEVDVGDAARITTRFEIIVANLCPYPIVTTNYDEFYRRLTEAIVYPRVRRFSRWLAWLGPPPTEQSRREEVDSFLHYLNPRAWHPRRLRLKQELPQDLALPVGVLIEGETGTSIEVPRVREDAEYFFGRRATFRLPKFPPGNAPAPAFPLR
jgi:hypothetical protein